MSLIEAIHGPGDLDKFSDAQLEALAAEIRTFLVQQVARTGGHLGPNLGVVELSIALHRTFDSPNDVVLWDTGHQAYVHKILTGRAAEFSTLRQTGGLSGYPSRSESPHDVIENSHASTSLAYADGIAKALQLEGKLSNGETGRHVVAVVGDGALTGGMAWEALNNIAGSDRQVIIVVNDNERSYAPTIGGFAQHLATLRTTAEYERVLRWGKRVLDRTPVLGKPTYGALHGVKKGVKDALSPQGMFEDLGLKYVGPVDGHDIQAMEFALTRAAAFPGPVIVHAITQKGRGYLPAELDEADRFHGVGVIDPESGRPISAGSDGATWTSTFSEELVKIGAMDPRVVAITAAMLGPTGLDGFCAAYPERTFDTGIAEQHAVASAAGMAYAGLHPVVAIYSTFINRAFDQVLLDCSMHQAPVTFVLDRAGVTGPDGASHHGMWDLSLLGLVPGLRIAAPRDGQRLRDLLNEAVAIETGPSVVRFPSGPVPADINAVGTSDGIDILSNPSDSSVLLVAIGATAAMCLEVAQQAGSEGIGVTVVDPRWVAPIPEALVAMASDYRLVITVEDNLRVSGVGSRLSQELRNRGSYVPVQNIGLPQEFLIHGKRSDVFEKVGLTAANIARQIADSADRPSNTA